MAANPRGLHRANQPSLVSSDSNETDETSTIGSMEGGRECGIQPVSNEGNMPISMENHSNKYRRDDKNEHLMSLL